MKFLAVLFSHTWDINHPFAQHFLPISHSMAIWVIGCLPYYCSSCVQVILIFLNNGPEHKRMMLAIWICQRKTTKCFLKGKGESIQLNVKKFFFAVVAKIYGKNDSSVKLWRRKKKFMLLLLSHLKMQELWTLKSA